MGLEVQLEHVVLVDVLGLGGNGERVAKQGQAGQGVIVLGRPTEGGVGAVAAASYPAAALGAEALGPGQCAVGQLVHPARTQAIVQSLPLPNQPAPRSPFSQ